MLWRKVELLRLVEQTIQQAEVLPPIALVTFLQILLYEIALRLETTAIQHLCKVELAEIPILSQQQGVQDLLLKVPLDQAITEQLILFELHLAEPMIEILLLYKVVLVELEVHNLQTGIRIETLALRCSKVLLLEPRVLLPALEPKAIIAVSYTHLTLPTTSRV